MTITKRSAINFLALDPGETTGWAYFGFGNSGERKLKEVGSIKFDGSFAKIRDELKALIESFPYLDLVVFEELIVYGSNTKSEKFKVEGIIELLVEDFKREKATMHPGTVKKLITGKGNCSKADLRRALKSRIEIPNKSNQHIVDAVCVGIAWLVQNTDYTL